MMSTSLWTTWERTARRGWDTLACVDARFGLAHGCSRGELSARAETLGRRMPADFIPGQTVAFAEGNGLPWLATFLGLQRIGAVALPLDASLPAVRHVESARKLGAHWFVQIAVDPALDWVWQALPTRTPPLAGDVCLVKTTSGSTGEPRPLPFTSAQMLADGRQIASTMRIGPGDINLGAIPFGHSYGLGNLILPLIVQGTAVVCSDEILPDALAEQMERHGATVLPSVPAVLRALAKSSVDPARLRALRRVVSAGAPLPPEVAQAFREKFGVPIQNFYGSSETGGICFDRTGEASVTGRSIGTPMDGVEVRLDGESRVTVCSAAVVAPGEHTLADLGVWNDLGELVLVGRATPLANIGGKKVAPAEIERVLRALEGVTDAWVGVGVRPAGGGDFLMAAVETLLTREQVQAALVGRLPAWQVPRRWWIATQLPRTARGKLDRSKLESECLDRGEAE